jgi:hypothetical protein
MARADPAAERLRCVSRRVAYTGAQSGKPDRRTNVGAGFSRPGPPEGGPPHLISLQRRGLPPCDPPGAQHLDEWPAALSRWYRLEQDGRPRYSTIALVEPSAAAR